MVGSVITAYGIVGSSVNVTIGDGGVTANGSGDFRQVKKNRLCFLFVLHIVARLFPNHPPWCDWVWHEGKI